MLETCIRTISVTVAVFCFYMLYRNRIVFKYRMRVLESSSPDISQCLQNHRQLPDYDSMMWQLTKFNWDEYWKPGDDSEVH